MKSSRSSLAAPVCTVPLLFFYSSTARPQLATWGSSQPSFISLMNREINKTSYVLKSKINFSPEVDGGNSNTVPKEVPIQQLTLKRIALHFFLREHTSEHTGHLSDGRQEDPMLFFQKPKQHHYNISFQSLSPLKIATTVFYLLLTACVTTHLMEKHGFYQH